MKVTVFIAVVVVFVAACTKDSDSKPPTQLVARPDAATEIVAPPTAPRAFECNVELMQCDGGVVTAACDAGTIEAEVCDSLNCSVTALADLRVRLIARDDRVVPSDDVITATDGGLSNVHIHTLQPLTAGSTYTLDFDTQSGAPQLTGLDGKQFAAFSLAIHTPDAPEAAAESASNADQKKTGASAKDKPRKRRKK